MVRGGAAVRDGTGGRSVFSREVRFGMINLCIVGNGVRGNSLSGIIFNELPDRFSLSFYDIDPEKIRYIRSAYPKCRVFDDIDDVIADPGIDALVVASPCSTHYDIAAAALKRGKHLLIEKIPAVDLGAGRELASLYGGSNCTAMMAYQSIFSPYYYYCRDAVQSGKLGRIRYTESKRVNLGRFQHDVNVFWDLGPHDLAMLIDCFGETPATVRAVGAGFEDGSEISIGTLTLRFPSGIYATMFYSWVAPFRESAVVFGGDKCSISYDNVFTREKVNIHNTGYRAEGNLAGELQYSYWNNGTDSPSILVKNPIVSMLDDFESSVTGFLKSRSDLSMGYNILRILKAADASLARGGVEIPLDDFP